MPAFRIEIASSMQATPNASVASDNVFAISIRPWPYAFALITDTNLEVGASELANARLFFIACLFTITFVGLS